MRSQNGRYLDARDKAYPDGVPAYEEIGNTAFITLDRFGGSTGGVDYYETPPTAEATDTKGIIIYAYSQIAWENSPIENVVLDVSCNMGGQSTSAVYTLGAFLGAASISAKDTLTGAMVTGNYEIDINLDGKIDEEDQVLLDKNLFCLESPVSFSCANLVTCAFKSSNRVSLLGRASGGGACIVYPFSTADGSYFQTSGNVQLSFLKNGSFYDNDQGAEPDFPLTKLESFYARQALAEYINEIR
jgi:C-terminal processing protease CtpA/Prc